MYGPESLSDTIAHANQLFLSHHNPSLILIIELTSGKYGLLDCNYYPDIAQYKSLASLLPVGPLARRHPITFMATYDLDALSDFIIAYVSDRAEPTDLMDFDKLPASLHKAPNGSVN